MPRAEGANAAKGRHAPLALISDPEFRASATLVASGCGAVYCVVCTIESVVAAPPCTDPTPWVVFVPVPCSDPAPVFESALAPSPAPVIPAAASVADAATCCPEACHARVHATACVVRGSACAPFQQNVHSVRNNHHKLCCDLANISYGLSTSCEMLQDWAFKSTMWEEVSQIGVPGEKLPAGTLFA